MPLAKSAGKRLPMVSTGNCVTGGVASAGYYITGGKRGKLCNQCKGKKTCNHWQGFESVFPQSLWRVRENV